MGNAVDQISGRWLNNRAENSHQPYRRRERAIAKFRRLKTLQKLAAVHASIHNHFGFDRHLNPRKPSRRTTPPRSPSVGSSRLIGDVVQRSETRSH